MPSQDLTVRVRTLGMGQYSAEMQKGAAATRGLGDSGRRVGGQMQRVGGQLSNVGGQLTRNVTLPILAIGGAAVKMAADFDSTFTQMQATAGVAGSEIDGLKRQVLALASETGRGPQELAEGLMLIRSSGFEGAQAMDVLQTSAEGAAAGMGSTREIANALTNVISGYGAANITAAEAMDVLTASVTEGKAEAAEMAPQFGRLIPVAAELGVEFSELAGVMAFLTKPTGDAALSATQLSGVLAKMLEPGVEGAAALKEVGSSAQELRSSIKEKGLHQTLIDLRKNLEANGMQLNDFAVDQQFLQGALLLTGASAEDAAAIIDAVGDSAGAADEAFAKWADSLGAKNAKAWAGAQAAMITFGDAALPVVAEVAEFVGQLLAVFADLPDGVQEAVLAFLGLLAAMGPLAKVTGTFTTAWSGLSKISGPGANFVATSLAAGGLTLALGGVLFALGQLVSKQAEAKKRISEFADALSEGGREGQVAAEELLTAGLTAGGLGEKLVSAGADLGVFTDDMRDGAARAKELQDQLQATAGRGMDDWKVALDDAADSGNRFAQQIQEIVEAEGLSREETINLLKRTADLSGEYAKGAEQAEAAALAQDQVAEAATEAGLAFDEQGNIVDAAAQKIEELKSALDELLGSFLSVDESVRRQNELINNLGSHFDQMTEKYGHNALALDNHTAAGIANSDMLDDLFEATAATTQAMIDQGASSEEIRGQWASDRGELQLLMEKFRAAGGDVSNYDELLSSIDELVATQITTPGMPQSQGRAVNYRAIMNSIPTSRNTSVNATGTTHAKGLVDRLRQSLDRLHDRRVNVNVVVTTSGALDALSGSRARGGPVYGNRLYEVAENSKHEMFESQGHRYLLPGADGRVIPMGQMASAAEFSGGGGAQVINLDLRGAIITGGERQFRQMVQRVFNEGNRKGRGWNAA